MEYFEKTLYFTTTLDLVQQILDVVILVTLLYNFRARDWPNYFMITSFELGSLSQFALENNKTVEITEAHVNFQNFSPGNSDE